MSGLRRALRRRVGRAGGSQLSDAQRELVRVVRTQPGVRVGEAAAELRLAANTVSTLVTSLVDAGWIRRETDPGDARSALLSLTLSAEQRVEEWRDRRTSVLLEAIGKLDEADREQIERAVPALERLVQQLQEGSEW